MCIFSDWCGTASLDRDQSCFLCFPFFHVISNIDVCYWDASHTFIILMNLIHLLVLLNSALDQTLLKRPVVMVSHEEVHRYLEVHTKKTEEPPSASESHLDGVSAEVTSVSIRKYPFNFYLLI